MNHRKSKKCKKSGCKARPLRGGIYCFAHEPARQEQRRAEQRRGGLTRCTPKTLQESFSLQSISKVKDMLQRVTNATLMGEIDLNRARVAGYLASLIITCLKDYDLEKRMEAIEARLAESNRG